VRFNNSYDIRHFCDEQALNSLHFLTGILAGFLRTANGFRFPLNHLGIRASLALRQHLWISSMAASSSSSLIAFTPPECSNFISRGTSKTHTFR
jgi:hypothetical protein